MYDYITTKPPLDENTLAHFGIKGMKWGVRKDKKKKPVSAKKQARIDKKNKIKEYKRDIKQHPTKASNINYYDYAQAGYGYKSAAKLKYDIKDRKMKPGLAYAKRLGLDTGKIFAMSAATLAAMVGWNFLGPGAGQYAKGNRMLAKGLTVNKIRSGIAKTKDAVRKKHARKSILKIAQKAEVIVDGPFRVIS